MVQVESDADSTEPLAQKKTRAKKEAKRSHKDKVDEFNKYLEGALPAVACCCPDAAG